MSRLTKRVRSDVSPMILKLLNLEEVPDECVEVNRLDSFREDSPVVFVTKEEAEAKLKELEGAE